VYYLFAVSKLQKDAEGHLDTLPNVYRVHQWIPSDCARALDMRIRDREATEEKTAWQFTECMPEASMGSMNCETEPNRRRRTFNAHILNLRNMLLRERI